MSLLESSHLKQKELLLQQQMKEKADLLHRQKGELASVPADQYNVLLRATIMLKHSLEIFELGSRYADLWEQLDERQKNEALYKARDQ